MLRQVVSSLLAVEGALPLAMPRALGAMYSTATTNQAKPQDWSMVLKTAAEVSAKEVTKPENGEVGLCAGIPLDTYKRQARIFSPAKTASQSGLARTLHNSAPAPAWRIGFETTAKWENPLMGWTSTADPLESVARASLNFYTKDEAIAFCKKHGWAYSLDEPNPRRTSRQKCFSSYGDNFSTKRKGVPDISHMPSIAKGLGTPK